MSLKLAVLASGSGTNFQAMVDAVRRGALEADIRLVICNRPGAKVIERAKAAGIICAVMDHKLWPSREAYDLAVADAILKSGADTVALAGYMRMLTAGFLNAFPHRVVNVLSLIHIWKQGVWEQYRFGRASSSRISSAWRLVTGTSAVGIR